MAEWVNGKVTQVKQWTDGLFSLVVNAPIDPFTAGQFAKLALEIDGERVQRAYSYVNAPDDANLEFYLVTVPEGKLSPRLNQLRPGSDVMVTKEAAGFFVLDEVRAKAKRDGSLGLVAIHDINLAARMCDQLVVLKKGHIRAQGSPADVLTGELVEGVYGVEADVVQHGGAPLIAPLRVR